MHDHVMITLTCISFRPIIIPMAMWQEINAVVADVSSLRRLLFAVTQLPKDTPNYWSIVCEFVFPGKLDVDQDKVRVLVENIHFMNTEAFATDKALHDELKLCSIDSKLPMGVVLISSKQTCGLCSGKLLVRSDRPSYVTLYSNEMGTVPATHFRKFCQNYRKGCPLTQHYGFCTQGEISSMIYDSNWDELPYFMSTSMTAFMTSFMEEFDADLLLGQIAYKQKADIYNYYHKYEQVGRSQTMRHVPSSIDDEDDSISSHTDPQRYHNVAVVG